MRMSHQVPDALAPHPPRTMIEPQEDALRRFLAGIDANDIEDTHPASYRVGRVVNVPNVPRRNYQEPRHADLTTFLVGAVVGSLSTVGIAIVAGWFK